MSTWETQEVPVLRALAMHFAVPGALPPTAPEIAAVCGLERQQVDEALRVVAEAKPPYVVGTQMTHPQLRPTVSGLTERAHHELEHAAYKKEAERSSGRGSRRRQKPPPVRGPLPPGALSS